MTFEEAYAKAERSARMHDGYVGLVAYNQILEQLEATYAPKIEISKSTFENENFQIMLNEQRMMLDEFSGIGTLSVREYQNVILHPECVEVINE